jgi:hypothetical protein
MIALFLFTKTFWPYAILHIKPSAYRITVMMITVLWAELWFVVVRCTLVESVGIVHILIRINVCYFRYIEQEREAFLIASAAYSTVPVLTTIHHNLILSFPPK